MRENKGITLIALVITIIVMLILVVVTIRISTKGGLFDYAGRAARETNDAIEEETDLANGKITIGGVTYDSIDEYISKLTKNANNWDLAYVCNSGTWSKEITDKNDAALTASDIIIAKFYKTGNKITPTLNGAKLDEGDAYELVIEGTGAMGNLGIESDLGFVGYAWHQSAITPYITKIVISQGITNIPYFAFRDATSLTEITIPATVTSIGNKAFQGCPTLTEIVIPTGVTSIGDFAFWICSGLTEITYNGTTAQWESIIKGQLLFNKTVTVHCTNGNLMIRYKGGTMSEARP